MAKELDLHTFQDFSPPMSAAQNVITLQDTVQCSALHSDAQEGYSIEQITSLCGVARRTAFKYANDLLKIWHWLPEREFRVNARYTEFALTEMQRLKQMGLKAYSELIVEQDPTTTHTTQNESALVIQEDRIIEGLTIPLKASERREQLQGELIKVEQANSEEFDGFMELITDLQNESQAAIDSDELEFQLLRKQNAAKWLKRKAILEGDKIRILQGEFTAK